MAEAISNASSRFKWPYLVVPGALSVLSAPVTAIWFLLLGGLLGLVAFAFAIAAAVARSERLQQTALNSCAVSGGIYLGPALYIGASLFN